MSESISLTSFITGTETNDLQSTDTSNSTQETDGNNNGNNGRSGNVGRGRRDDFETGNAFGRGGRGSGAAVIVELSQGAGNRFGQVRRGADDAEQAPNQPIAEPQNRQELNANLNAAVNAVTATFAGTPDGGNEANPGGVVSVPVGLDALAPAGQNGTPAFQVGTAPAGAPAILANEDEGPAGGGIQLAASFENTALGGSPGPGAGNQLTPTFSILDNDDDGGLGNRIEPLGQGALARLEEVEQDTAPQFGPAARAAEGLGAAGTQPQIGQLATSDLGGNLAITAPENDNDISILDDEDAALSRAVDPASLAELQIDPNASPNEAITAAGAGPDTSIADARDLIQSAEVTSPAEALAAREPAGENENGPPAGVLGPAAAQAPPRLTDEVEEDPTAAREPAGENANGPPAGVLAPAAAQEPPSLTDEVEEDPIAQFVTAEENTGGPAVQLANQAAPPEPAETAAENETNTAPAEPVVLPEPTAADEPATEPEANDLAVAPAPPAPTPGAGPAAEGGVNALAAPEPGPAPAELEAGRPNQTTTPGQEALEADAQLAFEAQQQDNRTTEPNTGSVVDLFIR